MAISFYDAAQVEELLDYPGCIEAMRQAMIALSTGERLQPLRQIFTVGKDQMFGTMPGELAALSIVWGQAGQRLRRSGSARTVAPSGRGGRL